MDHGLASSWRCREGHAGLAADAAPCGARIEPPRQSKQTKTCSLRQTKPEDCFGVDDVAATSRTFKSLRGLLKMPLIGHRP